MNAFFWLFQTVINLYIWVIIGSAIMSWLVAFNVINTHNRFVYMVNETLHRLTEPVLGPIRRFLPHLGGLDIAPIVLILVLLFIERLVIIDIGYRFGLVS